MDGLKCYFKKIHNQLKSGFTRALCKHGLTCTQFDLLVYLDTHTEQQNTLTNLSAHFGVKHTSMIHVLKLLDEKGFITRTSSSDGRSKAILLTGRGRQILTDVRGKGTLLNEIMFDGLSEQDMQLLKNMLQQICTNLESDTFQYL